MGASATVGLAGCAGFGDSKSDDGTGESTGGERVPNLVLEYWSDKGGKTKIFEDTSPVVREAAKALGMGLSIKPVEFTTNVNHCIDDMRTHDISYWQHTPTPDRLDPHELTRRYAIDWAGGNGKSNPNNYAGCKHSTAALNQASAGSREERRKLVAEAQAAMSEDLATMPVAAKVGYAGYRSDMVELKGAGSAGIIRTNPYVYVNSKPKQGNKLVAYTSQDMLQTTNYPIIDSSAAQGVWNHLVHSTLTEYDQNFELKNLLVEDYTVENKGKKITVKLKDATFHNGDPITAEDVAFTFKLLGGMFGGTGAYPQASQPPYKSIEAKDEKTVVFNMEEPFLPLISKVWPRWGIMHKKSWEGAKEDPEGFEPDEVIGSGPFAIDTLQTGSTMALKPHDGNPVHKPNHRLIFQVYRNVQTLFQAFQANEVQLASQLSPGIFDRIGQMDNAEQISASYFTAFVLYPQYPKPPMMFREMRLALGKALNRQKMNQLGFLGQSKPALDSCPLREGHPSRKHFKNKLTKFTDNPQGDVPGSKKVLKDAGYTVDGNGNLRYPADKDLAPRWPKGKTPSADEFPCLDQLTA